MAAEIKKDIEADYRRISAEIKNKDIDLASGIEQRFALCKTMHQLEKIATGFRLESGEPSDEEREVSLSSAKKNFKDAPSVQATITTT